MMKLYKLTDKNDQTYGDCQWGEGVTHTADGKGRLCTKHWIHAYTDPILAVLMNPIHGKYDTDTGHMWECEGEIGRNNRGLKVGCKKLTTIRRIDMPRITIEQRVRFAILCSKKVCKNRTWTKWANGWLNGKNKTADAVYTTLYATGTAAHAATLAASGVAGADIQAAYAAVYTVYTTNVADINLTKIAQNVSDINLIKIAHKAVKGD